MNPETKLHLFQGFGVELEYMVVDVETLAVKPITDQVIFDQVGAYVSEVAHGKIAWSNELVLHVIELKTNGPAKNLTELPALFQEQVKRINQLLKPYGAQLLPSGMHPAMNPFTQTKLWPHEYNAVYEKYNQIFDCRGHGWSNVQSTHLNLPFGNAAEFGRLHAAIRLLLPLIPALSAASPLAENKYTGFADTRLEVYRLNQIKIPEITGQVIPEAVFSPNKYQTQILEKLYQAVQPYDPEGILQEEFLNSRGAIARFERQAIEIRIIDNQECPVADIAILYLVVEVLKLLVSEKFSSYAQQQEATTENLAAIFLEVIKLGQKAAIRQPAYLKLFHLNPNIPYTAGQVWHHLFAWVQNEVVIPTTFAAALNLILQQGNLSERLQRVIGPNPDPRIIAKVYHQLADCLASNQMFMA